MPISIRSEKHPREFQKNIYFFIVECARAHFCVDHNKLWKILKEMGIPDHLSCLLRNLYASQEKAREFHKTIYFFFIVCATVVDCVDHNKLWKILREIGIPDHLTFLLRNLYAGQEVTELDVEQRTGSKLLKEYIKAIYCHPAYLTCIQSTS